MGGLSKVRLFSVCRKMRWSAGIPAPRTGDLQDTGARLMRGAVQWVRTSDARAPAHFPTDTTYQFTRHVCVILSGTKCSEACPRTK